MGQDTVAGWLVVLFEQLHLSFTHCAKCLGYIRNVRSEPLEEDDEVSTSITRTWECKERYNFIVLPCFSTIHPTPHTPHSTSTAVPRNLLLISWENLFWHMYTIHTFGVFTITGNEEIPFNSRGGVFGRW